MPHPPTLTEGEIDRLLYFLKTDNTYTTCPNNRPRNYLLGCLMADAGLRVSEAVALTPGQVFEPGTALTPPTKLSPTPLLRLHLQSEYTKNHVSRTIPLTERLTYALQLFHENQHARLSFSDCRWLFPSRGHSNHVTTRQVHRIIDRAGRFTLHRPVHPHLLRHTFATRIVRVSNTAVAQQLLGHKSLSSTNVYLHPNADDLETAVDALNKTKGQKP